MNFEIETSVTPKEPIFQSEHANITLKFGATNLTNDILLPIIEKNIVDNDNAIVFVQNENGHNPANMYIESGIYKIFVQGAFGIGYSGAGSSGVTRVLMALGMDYETADKLVTDLSLENGYIQVVFAD